jgi:hypothetical protein
VARVRCVPVLGRQLSFHANTVDQSPQVPQAPHSNARQETCLTRGHALAAHCRPSLEPPVPDTAIVQDPSRPMSSPICCDVGLRQFADRGGGPLLVCGAPVPVR